MKKTFEVRGCKYAPEMTKLYINGVEVELSTPQRQELYACKSVEDCKRYVRNKVFKQVTEYKKHALISGYHTLEKLTTYNGKVIGKGTFKKYTDVTNVINNFKGKNTECNIIVGWTDDKKPIMEKQINNPYCKVKIESIWM